MSILAEISNLFERQSVDGEFDADEALALLRRAGEALRAGSLYTPTDLISDVLVSSPHRTVIVMEVIDPDDLPEDIPPDDVVRDLDSVVKIDVLHGEEQSGCAYYGADVLETLRLVARDYAPGKEL